MDVENHEFCVLRGASKIFACNRPILYCEIWNNDYRPKTFEYLLRLDYKVKVISNCQLVDFEPMKHQTDNFLFIK